jgi:flavin-binding protein dodecin
MASSVAKVTELIGHSPQGWQQAAESALKEASKTLRGITGIEVIRLTGRVQNNKIVEYRADIKIAFGVER